MRWYIYTIEPAAGKAAKGAPQLPKPQRPYELQGAGRLQEGSRYSRPPPRRHRPSLLALLGGGAVEVPGGASGRRAPPRAQVVAHRATHKQASCTWEWGLGG
jgi:hypothetical protein